MRATTKKSVDKGIRLVNFLIDLFIIYFVGNLANVVLELEMRPNGVIAMVYFFYYLLLEAFTGQTLGKMVTGTWVRNLDCTKPSFWRIFVRTFLRFNPFDIISYLFGQEQGTHDVLSRTRLKFKDDPN